MRGIDISEAQKYIDLSKIDFDFVIIKATEGKTYTDPCFFKHLNNALKIGKPLGFYHYARPENNSAHDEVDNFLKAVGDLIGQGIPFLDWESSAKYNVKWALDWLTEFYNRTGVKPLIYMSESVVNSYDWSKVAPKFGLWVAKYKDYGIDYNYDMSNAGSLPSIKWWETCYMWQWTSVGRLDGYSSNLDCDEFYGEKSLWDELKKVEDDDKTDFNYIEVRDGVNTYYKNETGDCFFTINGRVSNFKVKEYACHDGNNEILIDGALVKADQKCRDKFGVTTINSGYRDKKYNESIGGAPNSQHVKGKATDIVCRGTSPLEVAMYAEALDLGGIGLYSTFTHIDTRTENRAKWEHSDKTKTDVSVKTFLKTIRWGSVGQRVGIAQKYLGVTPDNVFGNQTLKATKEFQKRKGLDVDGVIGQQTWKALLTQ
jgi:GH25 family lysozyme M1 (1,4-beta-N-acetylmuramidase)/peptidoglycan hydrolase-like protein with peptidoglycan-binding domain